MARNELKSFNTHSTDRVHLRAGAASWRALASVTVASALVVAVVVSALALVEAVFSNPATLLARQSPNASESPGLHANAQ